MIPDLRRHHFLHVIQSCTYKAALIQCSNLVDRLAADLYWQFSWALPLAKAGETPSTYQVSCCKIIVFDHIGHPNQRSITSTLPLPN